MILNVPPELLQQVANHAVEASKGQMTPGSYGIFMLVIMIAGVIARQYVPWFKARTERDNSVAGQLQALNDKMQLRIDALEEDIRAERHRCDEELAALRKRADDEMAGMRQQLEAMQRIIIQWQVSTGNVISLPPGSAPKATEAMDRLIAKLDGEQE